MRDIWTISLKECLEVALEGQKNTRPDFSVFRTRVHGCSDAELCRVPTQSTVRAIFLLSSWKLVLAMPVRLSMRSEDSVLQTELSDVNLIELLRQYFRRVDMLHLVETKTSPRVMLSEN